jgi:phosphatidylglycerol lysyltransferase
LLAPRDFTAVKVGASPYFDLPNWEPRGDCAKKMRAGINQARRAGVEIETIEGGVSDSLRQETIHLCMNWLESHEFGTTFSWLIALNPFLHSDHKKYFAARVNGKLVGFIAASPIPARKGWYLEDVLNDESAPSGTSTLLVVETLKRLRQEGAELATLGTSPLATDGPNDLPTENRVVARTLKAAPNKLNRFYNFEGLRRFKGKFVPSWWESEYALIPRGAVVPPRVAHAIIRAVVPGGLSHILTRQTMRVLRASGPALKDHLTHVTRTFNSSSKSASRKS